MLSVSSPRDSDIFAGTSSAPPYRRIAAELRADIEQGRYQAGGQLPTQQSLVRRFEVSRGTVQRALEDLRQEGYIDSQQGRGSYVLDRAANQPQPGPAGVELADHVEAAFRARHVTVDSYSLTAETLNSALQRPLQLVRSHEVTPESLAVRLVVPSTEARLALPRLVADEQDDRPLRRLRRLITGQAITLASSVRSVADSGHVKDVTIEIRTVHVTPLHKLYLLNREEALFGLYAPVVRPVRFEGEPEDIYDVLGLDATLFRYSSGPDETDLQSKEFVVNSQRWFDSLWSTIAQPMTLFQ